MKAYFFVDSDGTENVSNVLPSKTSEGFWEAVKHVITKHGDTVTYDTLTELPRGTIKALFDKELTYNDPPILVEQ